MPSKPDLQLEPVLDQAGEMDEGRRRFMFAGTFALGQFLAASSPHLTDEATHLAAWAEQTNVGDQSIALLADATHRLAENHTRLAPRNALNDVLSTHQQVQTLLRDRKPRLRQMRDLYKIGSDLLAHACILLGDLHNDDGAMAYGVTAALYAREAGANQAAALSAQAKTDRWRGRYAASAELARRGFDASPNTPLRIMLAGQQANALALLGDHERARQAWRRAEEAADGPLTCDSGISPWSCPPPRRALYALSVALQAGNHEMALRAAELADAAWASGDPWVLGTWAQVRFGAATAYVMMGELDGAAEQVRPVMAAMSPEFRLATVTNYLVNIDRRLQHAHFRESTIAADLREQIRVFNAAALPAGHSRLSS
jgi:tetratricopeptide (TPR) repeat protein